MACFLNNRQNTVVSIPNVVKNDNFTSYEILVKIGDAAWTVQHRYNDFVELHDKLVSDHGVNKEILPPKKVIGNMEPTFIERRRASLECYLRNILSLLQQAMPRELALFLDFHHYDILYLLQDMALRFFHEGDALLQVSKAFTFSPLQLHAISERLKQPCPPSDILDKRMDFSHVMDFCSQLTSITITGSCAPVRTSNIVPNQLPFELSVFKMVQRLTLITVQASNIYSVGSLRESVTSLAVHASCLRSIASVLLCDVIHKDVLHSGERHTWRKVVEADFSSNELEEIDEAVRLMPNVERLALNDNRITRVDNLTSLPRLVHLSLSANCLHAADDLHTRLGHVATLDLSQNGLTSLRGFSRLYSLESLDVGGNQLAEVAEVRHVSSLPCLENLVLLGNPVAIVVDYRVRVLEQFGGRAGEICLDNERPTQRELDKVAVLQALRIVKEGRTPTLGVEAPVFPVPHVS